MGFLESPGAIRASRRVRFERKGLWPSGARVTAPTQEGKASRASGMLPLRDAGFCFFWVRWGLDLLLSASQTWTHINGDGSALRTCHASHNEADTSNLFAGRLNLLQPSAALSFVASNDGDRTATG